MTITWKDPNMKLHGKRHKRDRYYFRWHYGKQRVVQMSKEYVDKHIKVYYIVHRLINNHTYGSIYDERSGDDTGKLFGDSRGFILPFYY